MLDYLSCDTFKFEKACCDPKCISFVMLCFALLCFVEIEVESTFTLHYLT